MKRKQNENTNPNPAAPEMVISVTREGDWLPLPEFLALALSAAEEQGNLTVDMLGVDHLDASALQILLALGAERKKHGCGFRLANASPALTHWFEYAGGGRTSLLNVSVQGNA